MPGCEELGALVKERPILFRGPMVKAIRAGKKTQTRRPVKPVGNDEGFLVVEESDGIWWPYRSHDGESWDDGNGCEVALKCPYGAPHDRLWVRETWKPRKNHSGAMYRADYETADSPELLKWKPSIFMPRALSRLTLKIGNVRVQRLHDISSNDALAEGISQTEFWTPKELEGRPFEEKWWDDAHFWEHYPRIAFQRLWETIHGKESWNENQWLWVIDFEVEP